MEFFIDGIFLQLFCDSCISEIRQSGSLSWITVFIWLFWNLAVDANVHQTAILGSAQKYPPDQYTHISFPSTFFVVRNIFRSTTISTNWMLPLFLLLLHTCVTTYCFIIHLHSNSKHPIFSLGWWVMYPWSGLWRHPPSLLHGVCDLSCGIRWLYDR